MLPVPRSWSAEEPSLTDEPTTSTSKSSKRSLSTSGTLSENEQSLIREQSIPEHSSEFSEPSEPGLGDQPQEKRRSSVIEEIPEFRERVEYFRRMSKEESVEDSVQSSSSSQFTPNTAKRIAGKIVVEVQKRALEQLTPTSDHEDSVFKMSKTSEPQKDTSQEEDGRCFVVKLA